MKTNIVWIGGRQQLVSFRNKQKAGTDHFFVQINGVHFATFQIHTEHELVIAEARDSKQLGNSVQSGLLSAT